MQIVPPAPGQRLPFPCSHFGIEIPPSRRQEPADTCRDRGSGCSQVGNGARHPAPVSLSPLPARLSAPNPPRGPFPGRCRPAGAQQQAGSPRPPVAPGRWEQPQAPGGAASRPLPAASRGYRGLPAPPGSPQHPRGGGRTRNGAAEELPPAGPGFGWCQSAGENRKIK